MKMFLKYMLLALILGLTAPLVNAQTSSTQPADDLDLGLGYVPQEIVDEWNDWYTNPTPANAFIADFMVNYNVPQTGLYGLTRLETWYWWASHHPQQVFAYMSLRDQQE
jgi:hypothetical protein